MAGGHWKPIMLATFLNLLERSRSSISWLLRLQAVAGFWFAGFFLGWGLSLWIREDDSTWPVTRALTGLVFLFWGLRLDTLTLPDGKTLDTAKAERERSRRSLLTPKVELPATRQRPGLRPAAWLLWLVSGCVLGLSELWLTDPGAQWAGLALVIAGVVVLALLGAATSSVARGEPSLRVRLSSKLFAGRRRRASAD